MREFNPTAMRERAVYELLTMLVVPRPIAWVSTLAADGTPNVAPHSYFNIMSNAPPVVHFTSAGEMDTLRNVRATGEFVINLASRPLMEHVNRSSAPYDAEVDEATAIGVTMEPSDRVAPMRVADSPASIECRLHSTVDLGESVVVLGDVVAITVVESALDGTHPMMSALQPVSRLGRDEWGLPPEVVHVKRPTRA